MIVKPKIPCEREACTDDKLCGQCGYMMQTYRMLVHVCSGIITSGNPKTWQNACKAIPGLETWFNNEKRMHYQEARKKMSLGDKIKAALPLRDN